MALWIKIIDQFTGGHILREVKIGGIITHETHSIEPIAWKIGTVNMDLSAADMEAAFERISRQLRAKVRHSAISLRGDL